MNNNFKSLTISGLLHGAILCSFMSVGTLVPAADMGQVIDFSLVERFGAPQKQAAPSPPAIKAPPTLKPVAKASKTPIVAKISVPVPAEELLAEKELTPEPVADDPLVAENIIAEVVNEAETAPSPEIITAAAPTPTTESHDQLAGAANPDVSEKGFVKELYVKANFHYIKDNIQKGIAYPRIARKMGWEGKVIVSFVVDKDGKIQNVLIVESSGFAALDKNAIATIKKAAPFPCPTVSAKLVVPVVYRLA
ncbi:MAG: energy transducer TonB [Desulfobulbaceae bacterium]|nr:energy transducer TonB [Desulfobulbaceae bacterium]